MAHSITYKDTTIKVGDTITISYKVKEGDKERVQLFQGILLKIKGKDDANRMITVRKKSHSGIGIERIIPLSSPYISKLKLDKKGSYTKSKLYFLRNLSDSELRNALYKKK